MNISLKLSCPRSRNDNCLFRLRSATARQVNKPGAGTERRSGYCGKLSGRSRSGIDDDGAESIRALKPRRAWKVSACRRHLPSEVRRAKIGLFCLGWVVERSDFSGTRGQCAQAAAGDAGGGIAGAFVSDETFAFMRRKGLRYFVAVRARDGFCAVAPER